MQLPIHRRGLSQMVSQLECVQYDPSLALNEKQARPNTEEDAPDKHSLTVVLGPGVMAVALAGDRWDGRAHVISIILLPAAGWFMT
jgi:hypothetical protein